MSPGSNSQVALPNVGMVGDNCIGSRTPQIQCGEWAGPQQHTPGEKDGVAVVTSLK